MMSLFIRRVVLLVVLACSCWLVVMVSAAFAAEPPARWRIDSLSDTTVSQNGELTYHVQAINIGGNTDGSPVNVTATLDPSMTGVSAKLHIPVVPPEEVDCTAGDGSSAVAGATTVLCSTNKVIDSPGNSGGTGFLSVTLTVKVGGSAAGFAVSSFEVSGGGAAEGASTVDSTRIVPEGSPALGFGFDSFDGLFAANAGGTPITQAGGHPYSSVVNVDFNSVTNPMPMAGDAWPVQPVKDVYTDLPAGFVGAPTAASTCTLQQLANGAGTQVLSLCPASSQVGTALIRFNGAPAVASPFGPVPVFNMVPPSGAPARFGFDVLGSVVVLDAQVRTGGDYGITIVGRDISQALAISGSTVTIWGVPSDPSHDSERSCPGFQPAGAGGGPSCTSSAPRRAFLRMPTSCTAPGVGLRTSALIDSWTEPGPVDQNGEPVAKDPRWHEAEFFTHEAPGYPYPPELQGPQVGLSGCEKEPFTPSVSAQPTSTTGDGPTGLRFAVSMPQEALSEPEAISQADIRKVTMTLPEGMTVNPAQANGLAACSQEQIALSSKASPSCPLASKIGTVTVHTPLLEEPLTGSVYLAAQNQNPFGTLLAIYIVAQGDGVTVKLPGRIDLDPGTGRLMVTVDNAPQQPVSRFEVEIPGGSHAPLIQPDTCGSKTINTELTGWNGKTAIDPYTYEVPCTPGLGGFAPTFTAGTTSNAAGSFAPFVVSLGRHDGEQQLTGLTFTMPPGVSAKLAGVTRCGDAEAASGNCPAASRIGSVTVAAGAGESPVALHGTVYLTGPYDGGPFGEVAVVPAVAGPFSLGDVVVRGSIRVNPTTAQATIVSDPFPRFVGQTGIPTAIRRVDVNVDRPGFTFNPTSCDPLRVTATLTGAQGASANVASRFQAADCANLAFHPSFTASTQGKVSRREGASLDVKIAFKAGEANIAKVRASLPKALPSRLDTLKLACRDSVFQADPAACPPASRVGAAVARTPILSSALAGPAYIVSHGGAAFPDLEMVLQGEGVTLVLDGHTDIKNNITTSTFETVPDVPVSSFELRLPEGVHSVLGAPGGSPCGQALVMPTTLTGQNGLVLRQGTKVAVSGCRPAIRVLRHSVHGARASIRVSVPSAGTLVASGKDVGRSVERVRKAGAATIVVSLTPRRLRVLAKHPNQRVNAQVQLTFRRNHGAPLRASVKLLMG